MAYSASWPLDDQSEKLLKENAPPEQISPLPRGEKCFESAGMKVLAERPISVERPARTISGVPILALNLATCVTVPFILVDGFRMADWPSMIGGVLVLAAMFIMWRGFFTVGPNECWIVMAWGS